jgi:hypothetical protein
MHGTNAHASVRQRTKMFFPARRDTTPTAFARAQREERPGRLRGMATETLIAAVLMYVLLPLWLAAGFADWLCHRRERIERTSGLRESALHALQLAEVGMPALGALFLEINGLVLMTMAAGLALHQISAVQDVALADRERRIPPVEQHVHGLLELLPWMAIVLLVILHWRDLTSFELALKRAPLPTPYLAAVLTAMGLFGLLPYGEELWRCWRWERKVRGN